jgi:hypothetical protein
MLDYKHESMPVAQFQRDYHSIDCQPVGQRLPVYTKDNSKEVGIIQTLLDGESIGMITIMELSSKYNRSQRRAFEKIFKRESIDGGHRKRAIWAFLNDEFRVGGFLFSEMEQSVKDDFLETELMFTVYKPLSTEKKGRIFRNLNKTTDVNFIEMVNSYGDISIANYIREKVRFVPQINNPHHLLFQFHSSPAGEVIYDYLSFDNDRLKQDHLFARIVHRYVKFPKDLLGGTSDEEIEEMYKNNDNVTPTVNNKIEEHLDFLRMMADCRKKKMGKGLSLHDFKILSALYLYLVDTYKVFNINDYTELFQTFSVANESLSNKHGKKWTKILHPASGYTVQVMYKRYINAPQHPEKTTEAFSYLLKEMGDIEKFIDLKDPKTKFEMAEKRAKLAEQQYICAIDGKELNMKDAHAAHIVAHAKGGKTVYSNLAMVRACYNIDMGTMDLNTYKETYKRAA